METLYFKGRKWSNSSGTGYAPQMATQPMVCDYDLAEEIVIEKRMAMSPDELMYAFKAVIDTVPVLCSLDGRTRKFTDYIQFKGIACGTLDSALGAWNETCHDNIKCQLLGTHKAEVLANFLQEEANPKPNLKRVTYDGATVDADLVKSGKAIVMVGTNMLFDPDIGDTAYIFTPQGKWPLTMTETTVQRTTFAYPVVPEFEDGADVWVEFTGRGGVEGGQFVTCQKKCKFLRKAQPPDFYRVEQGSAEENHLTLGEGKTCLLIGERFSLESGTTVKMDFVDTSTGDEWSEDVTQYCIVGAGSTSMKISKLPVQEAHRSQYVGAYASIVINNPDWENPAGMVVTIDAVE